MDCDTFTANIEPMCKNIFDYMDNILPTIKFGKTKIIFLLGMYEQYRNNNKDTLNWNCDTNLKEFENFKNKYISYDTSDSENVDPLLYYKTASSPWTAVLRRFCTYEILVIKPVYEACVRMILKDFSQADKDFIKNTTNSNFKLIKQAFEDCPVCKYIGEDKTAENVVFDENRGMKFKEISDKFGAVEAFKKYCFIVDQRLIDEKNLDLLLDNPPSKVSGMEILDINKVTGDTGKETEVNPDDLTYYSSSGGDETNCTCTPGYYFAGMLGNLATCKFDIKKWKSSGFYSTLKAELKDDEKIGIPMFVWFGNAPSCGYDATDVWMQGYIPIKSHPWGSGKSCWFGEKWLGFKPMTPNQNILVEQARQDILKDREISAETFKAAANLIGSILELIVAFA